MFGGMTDRPSGMAAPERALALSYAADACRPGFAALLSLDETLGHVLRTTREPLVGQMRLTWWFEALEALDRGQPPAQPVLRALAAEVLTRGASGADLAGMIDGWEALLDPAPLTPARLDDHAERRGALLFRLSGRILGATSGDPVAAAGAGWALADVAAHVRDPAAAAAARALARTALDPAFGRHWSRPARALGALALSARMDLARPATGGSPARVARLAWHRLTGR